MDESVGGWRELVPERVGGTFRRPGMDRLDGRGRYRARGVEGGRFLEFDRPEFETKALGEEVQLAARETQNTASEGLLPEVGCLITATDLRVGGDPAVERSREGEVGRLDSRLNLGERLLGRFERPVRLVGGVVDPRDFAVSLEGERKYNALGRTCVGDRDLPPCFGLPRSDDDEVRHVEDLAAGVARFLECLRTSGEGLRFFVLGISISGEEPV